MEHIWIHQRTVHRVWHRRLKYRLLERIRSHQRHHGVLSVPGLCIPNWVDSWRPRWGNIRLMCFLDVLFVAGVTVLVAYTINKDKTAALAFFYLEVGLASHIFASYSLPSIKMIAIDFVVASIACHKVEWFGTELTFPSGSLVTLGRWEALRLMAVITDHIAAAEPAFACTNGSHPVLVIAHQLVAFEAEEIVKLVWAFAAASVLEHFVREFVAEHEKISIA